MCVQSPCFQLLDHLFGGVAWEEELGVFVHSDFIPQELHLQQQQQDHEVYGMIVSSRYSSKKVEFYAQFLIRYV